MIHRTFLHTHVHTHKHTRVVCSSAVLFSLLLISSFSPCPQPTYFQLFGCSLQYVLVCISHAHAHADAHAHAHAHQARTRKHAPASRQNDLTDGPLAPMSPARCQATGIPTTYTSGTTYTITVSSVERDLRLMLGSTTGAWSSGTGGSAAACSQGGQRGYYSGASTTQMTATWTAPADGTSVTVGWTCGNQRTMIVGSRVVPGEQSVLTVVVGGGW
jgi:hypothetical protein